MKIKYADLKDLPWRQWDLKTIYNDILVVRTGKKHESGFHIINIIGIRKGQPIEIAASCDDICWKLSAIKHKDGTILDYALHNDMYYPSGIIRYWSNYFDFEVGTSLSSTDVKLIYSKEKNKPAEMPF